MPIFEPVGRARCGIVFTGSAETLTFVAPSANGPQGAGLYRFTLEMKPQGTAGNALVVAVAPYVSARRAGQRCGRGRRACPVRRTSRAPASATTGARTCSGTPAWQTEWTRRDALPDAVELSVASGRSARTILIALRLKQRAVIS